MAAVGFDFLQAPPPPSSSFTVDIDTKTPLPLASVDCEMCFTVGGFEVVRVSVVDEAGAIMFDSLVRPRFPVVDYNTEFSGVDERSLAAVQLTFDEMRRRLFEMISARTILVGQSLQSDLKALQVRF
jgi:RNA exonuclease 1